MSERTRLDAATKWVGYHFLELAAVIGTLIAAAQLTWWIALLTATIATLWAAQEWRAYRKRAQLRIRGRDQLHLSEQDTEHAGGAVRVLPREGA
jgi:membrane protein implicated in regulation of membrane protease activity